METGEKEQAQATILRNSMEQLYWKKSQNSEGSTNMEPFFSRITVFQPSTFPKKTPLHEFSREFRDIFRSSFFKTHLCVTASDEESILGIKNIVYVLSQLK